MHVRVLLAFAFIRSTDDVDVKTGPDVFTALLVFEFWWVACRPQCDVHSCGSAVTSWWCV